MPVPADQQVGEHGRILEQFDVLERAGDAEFGDAECRLLRDVFIVMIDPFLTYLKDDVPGMVAGVAAALGAGHERAAHIQDTAAAFASANGLKGAIYGLIIVLFVLFEPLGLYGRWLKIKLFFQLFPLYKRATFKRQKIYVKSERNR